MVRFTSVAVAALAALPTIYGAAFAPQIPLNGQETVHTTQGWGWELCNKDTAKLIDVKSIEVSPNPPKPGQDLTVTVNGIAKEEIEEGAYADVTVKLGLVKLLQKQFDVCEEARNAKADIQCPVKPGEYTVSQTVALPKEIPRAKFKVHVEGWTVDDDEMLCLDLNVDFLPRFPHPGKFGF